MTKAKLGEKHLNNNLNFKIISVSNENYLSYQLFSHILWYRLHRENFRELCRIQKWMDEFLASEQNINVINSSCRCCR